MVNFSVLSVIIWMLVSSPSIVRSDFKLQIVHTNDMHARFEEVNKAGITCSSFEAKENKCYGGFARIKKMADDTKAEARRQNISSIFVNAGDTFQGTAYYSVFKWKVVASLMNMMGFDVMCLGNHEFDDGIDDLIEYLKHTKIPAVTANLNRTSEKRLNQNLLRNSVVLDLNGRKIGIVGYLAPETMGMSSTENLEILDEIPHLRAEAKSLKSKGVNFIIGLGHSGLARDKEIAKEVEEVDLIIGGHSHSLLYNPKDKPPSTETIEGPYPFWVTQKSGKKVPIVQSASLTKYIGILTLTIDDQYRVTAVEGNSHLLDYTYEKNYSVEKKVNKWTTELKKKLKTVIGETRVSLTKSRSENNEFESNLANLITDAIFDHGILKTKAENLTQWTKYAAALYQNGGIKTEFNSQRNGGNLTLEDIFTALPVLNTLYQCRLPGKVLQEALELSVLPYHSTERPLAFYFLHFSGLQVVYDLRQPPTKRVKTVMVICTRCSVPYYEALKHNETYTIILNSYLLKGADNFTIFRNLCEDQTTLGSMDSAALVNYIQKRQILYPILDGRLRILKDGDPSAATMKNLTILNLFLLIIMMSIQAAA